MALYRIHEGRVTHIPQRDFPNEATLQKLMDDNLEQIAGIRVVERQYAIPNGRMDTLGIDEHNVPVVVEYKWGRDPGAINQGLFYLDWVTQNRRPFELLVKERYGKGKVNWTSAARLLVVAKQFDLKETSAVRLIQARVQLYQYSFYGDMLAIEEVTPQRSVADARRRTATEPVQQGESEDRPVEVLLVRASDELRALFIALRDEVLNLGADVREKVGDSYTDYRKTSTFATIFPQTNKNRLRVYIKMGNNPLDDPDGWASAIPESYSLGRLNRQFFVQSADQLNYAMRLIGQAYDYVP